MIIKNYKQLAISKERKDALNILNYGIEAVLIEKSVKEQIKLKKNILTIQNLTWDLSKYKRIFVVGAGKASIDLASSLEKVLGNRIIKGIVIDTRIKKLKKIIVKKGTHPLPSQDNIKATKEIVKILNEADKDDLVIILISGGGSALLSYPRIKLNDLIKLNKALLSSGATIHEINIVRKHLSFIKGGQLAQLAQPAELITLIVSDVMGNNLDVIASGPTVLDKTTNKRAERILKKYNISKQTFTETPKDKLTNVTNILLITNKLAAKAMKEKAIKLGYKAKILSTNLTGEAKTIGKLLAKKSKKGICYIATGETTVKVKGNGKGGRNQEVALSALSKIKDSLVLSCGSDGVDFIEDAAGGIVDEETIKLANKKNLNNEEYRKNNDAYNFLSKTNSIIKTGKTGTNVGDLMIALGDKK